MRRFWLFACLVCVSMSIRAETRYVTDTLYITLRTGQGDEFRILRALKSGTALEVIEDTENNEEYSHVKTEDGLDGWVRNKYLVTEPVAADLLAKAEQQAQKTQQENEQLKEQVKTARTEMRETEKERKRLDSENQKLKTDNEHMQSVAAKPLELDKENKTLSERNAVIEKELTALQQENTKYKDSSAQQWFLMGAGVLLGGMILGFIIPKIRWRKNSDWI